jgi:hypothetical protein
VTVAGELNAYIGSGSSVEGAFPSSRMAVGHVSAGLGPSAEESDVSLSGLLPASSPLRAQAQAGEWSALAAWKVQGAASSSGPARALIADRGVSGDLARYAAAFQAGREASPAPPPRVVSRQVAAFMDHSDYSCSADPRAAAGERAEDLPAARIADVVGGFAPLPD